MHCSRPGSGSIGIEIRNRTIEMKTGDPFVAPRGVEQRPFAGSRGAVRPVERRGMVNTGDADSDLRAENDVWLQRVRRSTLAGPNARARGR